MEKKRKSRKRRGRGEGGVTYREDQRIWEGSISLGFNPDGTRNRPRVFGQTKQEVIDKLNELRAQARVGTLPDKERLTVGQLLARWLTVSKEKLAPASYEVREISVKTHIVPRLGTVHLAKLNALHVEGFYSDMAEDGVGPTARRSASVFLCGVLKYALKRRLIAVDPSAGVEKPPKPKREMLFLTAAQSRLLLETAIDQPCYCLLAVALASGCRQGELLALEWPEVNLEAGTLTVKQALTCTKAGGFQLKEPKSAAGRRTISLPAFAALALRERRTEQFAAGLIRSPVFCTSAGKYQHKRNVLRSLRQVIERVNDPHKPRKGGRPKKDAPPQPSRQRLSLVPDGLRFHDLRHSHASILLSAGESLKAVSQRLGHADPAMTLRVYAHCMPADDARLAGSIGRLIG